jgi:hypothetical protein
MSGLTRLALTGATIACVCNFCIAKEKERVTVTYVLAPAQPLPEGLKAVAVIDAGVQTQGDKQDDRERKWSTMAADMIEAMLGSSASRFGSGLNVAQRRQTQAVLKEQDLRLAGLVEGEAAAKAGKLLAVQGLIVSRITIDIDVQKGSKSTMDWGSVLGGVVQGLGEGRRERGPRVVERPVVVQPAPRSPVFIPRSGGVYAPRGAVDPRRVDPRSARDPRSLRFRRYQYDPRYRAAPGYAVVPGAVAPAPAPYAVVPGQPVPVGPGPGMAGGPAYGEGDGGEPPVFGLKQVEEVRRHLTVQCSFSLIDAVTGRAVVQYSPAPYQKLDTASPDFMFGSMMKGSELDPVDHFIGELVERATQEFVSMLVPTEVEYAYELTGHHSEGEAGIRSLRADDYDEAYQHFLNVLRKYDDDDETAFSAGVASELLGQPQQALEYYRRAASMKGADKDSLPMYVAAKKRLTEHLPRIVKADAATQAPPSKS